MVARINKLADPELYTGGYAPYAGKWLNPSGLFQLTDNAPISDRDFLSLWKGFAPGGGWSLSRRALARTHTPGLDIVLSPDKSVSALWAISPEFDRKRIERAVVDAARVALACTVFRHCATTRAGTAGRNFRVETGDILAAVFPHHISRECDPQLDVSCVVFNLVRSHSDRRYRTLHRHPIFSWKEAIGATFRNRLAHRLRDRLRARLERHGADGEYTRLQDMDRRLEQLWSKRHAEVPTNREGEPEAIPTALHAARRPNPALRTKRTATEADMARFRDEAAVLLDLNALHRRIVRSTANEATERALDSFLQEIGDIPRKLAAADLAVENAAAGQFDDDAMEKWHRYALSAESLLPLEYDDPNPDAVALLAHKRIFTTRDILDGNLDRKRLSGLSPRGPQSLPSTEQPSW